MTARLVSAARLALPSASSTSVSPLPVQRSTGTAALAYRSSTKAQLNHRLAESSRYRSPGDTANIPELDLALVEKAHASDSIACDQLLEAMLDSLPNGVILASRDIKPVYVNSQATALCQLLMSANHSTDVFPLVISEICHRLIKEGNTESDFLVVECQTQTGQTIRIRARWLELHLNAGTGVKSNRQFIQIFLENCDEVLRAELRIEQKKYDLTEREAEIWMLLRQEYTYQEIAQKLQISLNTVKTHVKNVYAKKRSCQGRDKVVVF